MKKISSILNNNKNQILREWVEKAQDSLKFLDEVEIEAQSKDILERFIELLRKSEENNSLVTDKKELDNLLKNIIIQWTKYEVKVYDVSKYLLTLEDVIYDYIKNEVNLEEWRTVAKLIANIVSFVNSSYLEIKEEIINSFTETIKEVEIPILRINYQTILIPLTGIIDSEKAMRLMKKTLINIREKNITNVVLDIEGVPIIDTDVANQLIKLERGVRLMGAKLVISGFRPEVAETMTHLDIELNIPTTSTLELALKKLSQ